MPFRPYHRKRPFFTLLATAWCMAAFPVAAVRADDAGTQGAGSAQPSATISLINRMVERGAISKQDAAELIAQANADAAEAQVQVAEAQLAAAKAQAAVARAKAAAAVLQAVLSGSSQPVSLTSRPAPRPAEAPAPTQAQVSSQSNEGAAVQTIAPSPAVEPQAQSSAASAGLASVTHDDPSTSAQGQNAEHTVRVSDVLGETMPASSQAAAETPGDAGGMPPRAVDTSNVTAAVPVQKPTPADEATLDARPQVPDSPPSSSSEAPTLAQDTSGGSMAQVARAPVSDAPPADGTVHVAYVPDVVRNEITEEVKDEVIAQAHKEGWGQKVPGWATRFDLYGDIRLRFEQIINHANNEDNGSFPNFNAINTGAPFDTAGAVYSPQFNVNQNRERERLRARMGAAVDLQNGFTVGMRLATGNDNNPVTENQTFGAAGSGQGGDFAKYSVWLDRAYLKYESSGDPSTNLSVTMGRFENPFFATNLLWANDLGFDGAVLKLPLKVHVDSQVVDSVKPFLVAGIFPVFNTDLNFGTNEPSKFASYDKWLGAAQIGSTWKLGGNFNFKTAAAIYYYVNIQGQLSAPFTPLTSSDSGSTDASRPSFAQNGNTYMAIRDITPGPTNNNGTIDQWQYYGLATPFHDAAFTQEIDFNGFEPFRISLIGEYVDNLAFNKAQIAAKAVNNLGTASANATAPFVGGNKGWFVNLKLGDAVLDNTGNWNFGVGYRHVESDSVVDAFTDADFGGDLTGTNLEGLTLTAAVAITHGVWIEGKWFSATAIAGPTFKNDTLQFDMNAKF